MWKLYTATFSQISAATRCERNYVRSQPNLGLRLRRSDFISPTIRYQCGKESRMTKRINLEIDLPDDVAAELRNEDLTAKVKESLVLELLREHRISQGKAAELSPKVRQLYNDQLSSQLVNVDARNSVAVKPALARSRDEDSFGLSSGYSSTNSCFHLFFRGEEALAG